jgi:division/cell wall cluster transcriptional repressor MraZ
MLQFCGLEKSLIDKNGRLKLGARLQSAFASYDSLKVVLFCLPEGAIGLYPEAEWERIRPELSAVRREFTGSVLARRKMRMIGAMTASETLSNQGRVTLPPMFREICAIGLSEEVVIVGSEFGVEIWNKEKWNKEMNLLQEHSLERGALEMDADLQVHRSMEDE